ncbi:MAG: hypothetical protein Q8Q48_02025 [Candidatus Staskawiczbacteria bacterium]|nr:hypothetical protein [Candidatus Staskawiczbacteria bacterium]
MKRKKRFSLPAKEEQAKDEALARKAKDLKALIKRAHKNAQKIRDRDREKTGVCRRDVGLLSRFRQEMAPDEALVTINHVEADIRRDMDHHPQDLNLLEDLTFAVQQKKLLLEAHPRLREREELAEDCPCNP